MEGPRFFLIVNLIAGHGRCKELFPKVRDELDRRRIDYDLHFTNEPLEATDVCKMGLEAGFTHIVAMGGDGTVNEVANGLCGVDVTMCVIPAGNGNDFVRTMGIPADPIDALDVLTSGRVRMIDVGRVADDRYVVNGLGIGIDAQVARDVLEMERLRGVPAYLTAAVKEVFRFKAFPVTLEVEGWTLDISCLSLGVANGPFCGGGFKLAPKAAVDDGLIDIAAIGDFPKLERLIRLPQARAGNHLRLSRVHYRQVERVTIKSPAKLVAHIDGEPYRLPKEAFGVSVVPSALRVLVPT
jgi:diacylglycerol kinase (ATP)